MRNVGIVIAVILIALLVVMIPSINNIPKYDEAVKASWSQVLNQYKRRSDLVPNLVSTVKGYAAHEEKVLVEVTKARSAVAQMTISKDILNDKAAFAQFQSKQNELSSALSRLLVTVEKYPDLKANQNFVMLQSQLEGTENRISVARRDYIQAVQIYNTELRTFPGRLWHMMLYSDMKLYETFSVDEATQRVPEVNF
ncbi:LemA family protein [Sulfurimonas sp. HSL3-2]|uniref:LemA family protein n=1 Tax=Hydrocurvibacter mobilis TaxID=3131936 RepID=UPI0031F93D7B